MAIGTSKIIGLVQMVVGVFTLLIWGICTLLYLFNNTFSKTVGGVFFTVCLVFDIIGIIFIVFSRNRKKLTDDFLKYTSAISADPTGSIANLAASIGTTQDKVKKNLELMIKRKFFKNIHINQETNCIIIGNSNTTSNIKTQLTQQMTQMGLITPDIEFLPVTCSCCGGTSRIAKGKVVECNFCGSPINS